MDENKSQKKLIFVGQCFEELWKNLFSFALKILSHLFLLDLVFVEKFKKKRLGNAVQDKRFYSKIIIEMV